MYLVCSKWRCTKRKETVRAESSRRMLTLVSNRDFAIMIARMGFAHGRSIVRVDVHDVHLVKGLIHGVGCITPIVKRNCVVCAANACITVLPSALAL